ncbi:MAG: 50S ribosomal protein L24 [Sulfobacillus sp.]
MAVNVRKGDLIRVIAGRDKGKEGRIVRSIPREERVLVEKINLVKRHQKPNQEYAQGGIITKEAPIHVSNVMLVCPSCKKATRVAHKFLDSGKKVRACKKCGAAIE